MSRTTMADGVQVITDELVSRDERIRQLEALNASLAAEINRMRPIVEACQRAKNRQLIRSDSGFTVGQIYDAIIAYEASQPK